MRNLAAVLFVVLVAPACKQADKMYPTVGGGGGGGGGTGGGGTGPDAATVDALPNNLMSGRACLVTDARQLDVCATTGAAGFTVALDGKTATTAADGTFTIDTPVSSTLLWKVTGATINTSLMNFSAVHHIPVMRDTDYIPLQTGNGVTASTGFGDVFIHVTHGGTSAASVAATSSPLALYPTLFDGGNAATWTQIGTGTYGMVWVPQLAQGTASVTLTPLGGAATVVANIPVGDGTATFVTVELP